MELEYLFTKLTPQSTCNGSKYGTNLKSNCRQVIKTLSVTYVTKKKILKSNLTSEVLKKQLTTEI